MKKNMGKRLGFTVMRTRVRPKMDGKGEGVRDLQRKGEGTSVAV